jgi:superfamily II DNA or RNA helicase
MNRAFERILDGTTVRVIEHARRLVAHDCVSLIFQATADDLIEAEVQDSHEYRCRWQFQPAVVTGACDCHIARLRVLCVHLAAALIALADTGEAPQFDEHFVVRIHGNHDRESESEAAGDASNGRVLEFAKPKSAPEPPTWWKTAIQAARSSAPQPSSVSPLVHEFRLAIPDPRFEIDARTGPNPVEFAVLHVTRTEKRDGQLSRPKPARAYDRSTPGPGAEAMRRVAALLDGAVDPQSFVRPWEFYRQPETRDRHAVAWKLRSNSARPLLQELCASGLLRLADNAVSDSDPALRFDPEPYRLALEGVRDDAGNIRLDATLRRGDSKVPIREPLAITRSGLMVFGDRIAILEPAALSSLAVAFRQGDAKQLAESEIKPFVQQLLDLPFAPQLTLPSESMPIDRNVPLVPELAIDLAPRAKRITARVRFIYDSRLAPLHGGPASWLDTASWSLTRRDLDSEARRLEELRALGLALPRNADSVSFAANRLPDIVHALHPNGWVIRAADQKLRAPSRFSVAVKASGIDWFDLAGGATFGEFEVTLPRLLEAIERGRDTIELDDGSVGMIPTRWLKARRGLLAAGKKQDDSFRFKAIHAALLGAMLDSNENEREAAPAIDVDAAFTRVLESIRRHEKPKAEDPHESFRGELRPYQREGLGWMRHLTKLGFGGCLADDMGLGKTVQVLALLAGRTPTRKKAKPSLVVAPRSVALNWVAEAARFAPTLVVAPYYGTERASALDRVKQGGVLVTTYGTLRNDAALDKIEFDFVVLDEAQAIKNRDTITARAARSLRADHRLALSGTPVENHFGEVLSLFDFINPGLLGRKVPKDLDGEAERPLFLRALRPFILRRTKREVAPDLPARTEQTIYCTLEPEQRRLYDELRDHYRAVLLERVEAEGMDGARFQVLEALLRLRQAACHPRLIDSTRADDASAKLDTLVPRLQEVVAESSKALVFSQFTSFLALLKPRLDELGIRYEYLDGQTRDRQERVARFQSDPECPLFLISLKAGGLGLNLTAAEYVFLLDPWWNPAVEAQAIDRAHRIGQTRAVFAYRLLAKDTVEERVAELQARKRELFDMLMTDTATLRDFDVEDLRVLLS